MSLSKKQAAALLADIRRVRIAADTSLMGRGENLYPCLVGGLQAVLSGFLRDMGHADIGHKIEAALDEPSTDAEIAAEMANRARLQKRLKDLRGEA